MSDKPRRAWFQIHLSTAIVLMFMAGGMMLANFRGEHLRVSSEIDKYISAPPVIVNVTKEGDYLDENGYLTNGTHDYNYGWPF